MAPLARDNGLNLLDLPRDATVYERTIDLLGNDDLGDPTATFVSFGGGSLGGTIDSYVAGASFADAIYTLTVNADGTVAFTTRAADHTVYFDYRIRNSAGFSDAFVVINVRRAPPGGV